MTTHTETGPLEAGRAKSMNDPLVLGSAAAGGLALIFSFFPILGPKIDLGGSNVGNIGGVSNGQLDEVLDKVRGITASAWDLQFASRGVVLAVVASLLIIAPLVEPSWRSKAWLRVLALLASALSVVFLLIQTVSGAGILGRAMGQLSDIARLSGDFDGSFGVNRRWALWVVLIAVIAQFVTLLLAQLKATGRLQPKPKQAAAASAPTEWFPQPGYQQTEPGYQQPQPGYQQPEPGYQQPQYGYQQPEHQQYEQSAPAQDQPHEQYSEPAYNQPAYNQPAHNQPAYGQQHHQPHQQQYSGSGYGPPQSSEPARGQQQHEQQQPEHETQQYPPHQQ